MESSDKEGEKPKKSDSGFIFRAFITLRNGRRLYARQVGLKAFRIPVKDDKGTGK